MSTARRNVDGNSRLTALLGATILPLFFATWLLGKVGGPGLIAVHVTVGLVFMAPMVAKLATVAYRLISYYRGVLAYRTRGRPPTSLRLLGAVLGISVLLVLASGLAMLLGPTSVYSTAKSVHSVGAWIAIGAILFHLAAHIAQTKRLVVAELRSVLKRPAHSRRRVTVVGTSLLIGAILAAALFHQASMIQRRDRLTTAVTATPASAETMTQTGPSRMCPAHGAPTRRRLGGPTRRSCALCCASAAAVVRRTA